MAFLPATKDPRWPRAWRFVPLLVLVIMFFNKLALIAMLLNVATTSLSTRPAWQIFVSQFPAILITSIHSAFIFCAHRSGKLHPALCMSSCFSMVLVWLVELPFWPGCGDRYFTTDICTPLYHYEGSGDGVIVAWVVLVGYAVLAVLSVIPCAFVVGSRRDRQGYDHEAVITHNPPLQNGSGDSDKR